jgi:hypothetical protein
VPTASVAATGQQREIGTRGFLGLVLRQLHRQELRIGAGFVDDHRLLRGAPERTAGVRTDHE